jgi:chromosome segregation ATPase
MKFCSVLNVESLGERIVPDANGGLTPEPELVAAQGSTSNNSTTSPSVLEDEKMKLAKRAKELAEELIVIGRGITDAQLALQDAMALKQSYEARIESLKKIIKALEDNDLKDTGEYRDKVKLLGEYKGKLEAINKKVEELNKSLGKLMESQAKTLQELNDIIDKLSKLYSSNEFQTFVNSISTRSELNSVLLP